MCLSDVDAVAEIEAITPGADGASGNPIRAALSDSAPKSRDEKSTVTRTDNDRMDWDTVR